MKKFVGEDINFPDEFDAIDENSVGKIYFSDLADWVLQKSLEIEIGKNKKKEEVEEKDELDETNDQIIKQFCCFVQASYNLQVLGDFDYDKC